MQKIYIVEDDIGISKSLDLYLKNSWYEVNFQNTWENALENILKSNPDLVILDINLPVKNGIEICKELREKNTIPIIMLTARNMEKDKLDAFSYWADDYISKPFSPRELLARIKSIFRRLDDTDSHNEDLINYKNIVLNLDKQIVYVNNNIVDFTKNEFDILKKIFEANWKIVHREELMDLIWYKEYLFDRTIDTHIKNIRKKLDVKDVIITVRGEGYRLNK